MKTKALFAVALMLLMAFAFVIPAEDDDAAITSMSIEGGNTITVDQGKTVKIVLDYTTDRNEGCTIKIVKVSDNTTVHNQYYSLVSGAGSLEIYLDDLGNTSPGKMKLTYTSGGSDTSFYFDINYTTSIWSNAAIYIAIIAIVILVIALVLFKSRMAPKQKNQLTFEQIEAEKQAQKTSKPEEKKPSASKSERQRYLASKKK
ncbi:hypothetical protein PED39_04835 [Methanomassiliicoccales archaeon LGM-RCC1]|nr:hypothetical protein PED39_04835 [Methanomassiliicoccales archaeon LGM-RCC1]